MLIFLLIIVVFLLFYILRNQEENKEKLSKILIEANRPQTNNEMQGNTETKKDYRDGKLWRETEFLNGKRNGRCIEYCDKGLVKTIIHYRNDEETGRTEFHYFDNGEKAFEIGYLKVEKHGLSRAFNQKGILTESANYENGLLHGERHLCYDDTGTIRCKESYVRGKLDGVRKTYFRSQALSTQEIWTSDRRNGLSSYYYEDGTLESQRNFEDEKIQGVVKSYYENGKLKIESPNYLEGIKNGIEKRFYPTGELLLEVYHQGNKFRNREKMYHANGKLKHEIWTENNQVKKQFYDENGSVVTDLKNPEAQNEIGEEKGKLQKAYYADGKVKYEQTFEEADVCTILKKKVSFYENGAVKSRETFRCNEINEEEILISKDMLCRDGAPFSGTWKESDVNGKVVVEEHFVDGKLDGLAKYFYSKYSRKEATYEKGVINGRMRFYDHRGSLMEEIDFKNGKKHGSDRAYHENEALRYKSEYKDGERVFGSDSRNYHENGKLSATHDSVLGDYGFYDKDGNLMPKGKECFDESDEAENGVLNVKMQLAMGKLVSTF